MSNRENLSLVCKQETGEAKKLLHLEESYRWTEENLAVTFKDKTME
jgi:hypothetical protein